MTVILTVDPGYRSCGWAITSYEGQSRVLVDAGEWCTNPEDGDELARVALIEACFIRKLAELKPNGVGIEAYTHQKRKNQNFKVAGNVTRLIDRMGAACRAADVPFEEVPTTLSKMSLGLRGKVSKERVRRAVEAMFGTRISAHMADAVAVGPAVRSRLLARGIGR